MNRIPSLVQRDGREDGDHVLRSATSLAAREFSAEVGVIDLDLSPQQVGLLTISHRQQNHAAQQASGVVLHTQLSAELQREDPTLGLADQVKGQKTVGQSKCGGVLDGAGSERGLMASVATLIAFEPPAIVQSRS